MMDHASLIERIRGLLLQASPKRSEVDALASEHAEQVRAVNATLARCHAWSQRGLGSEAFSLGESVHLAQHAAALRLEGSMDAWTRLLQAAGLGAPSHVDAALLETYVVTAGRQQSLAPLLAAMRVAALRRAPISERLATLRALVDRDARQPAWLESIRKLEREAVASLAEAARQAIRDGDAEAASAVMTQVEQMSLRVDDHRDVFDKARSMAEADRLLEAQRGAKNAVEALHAAAAAMDMAALKQAAQAWEKLASAHALGETLRREAAGPLDLLRRERERAASEAERAAVIGKLELALDQAAGIQELDRLADAAVRADAALPAAVARRLQERRTQAGAAQARRRASLALGAVLLAAVLGAAGWWGFQWWSDEQRFAAAIAEIDRAVAVGDFATAERVAASEAADARHASRAELAAAKQRVANAQAAQAQQVAASTALLAEADALLKQSEDPLALEARARELLAAVDRQPASMQEAFRQSAARLQSAAVERRDRGLDQARASQRAVDAALAAVADPAANEATKSDPVALRAASDQYAAVAREAREASVKAASHRDAQAVAEALQATANIAEQKSQAARTRAERIEQVASAFDRLEKPSVDEEATLEQWRKLLQTGGDVLAERGMLRASESGMEAAKAGMAIRAWRTVVVPSLIAGRGDPNQPVDALDWGDPVTARALDATLTKHLDEHANTPYHASAETMRGLARRTLTACGTAPSLGEAALAALKATGYGGLYEQGFEGGRTLYVRRLEGSAAGSARAVDSKKDLSTDASALAPRKLPAFRRVTAERMWPSSKAVDAALAELKGTTGRQARDRWLRMLAELRTAEANDPVLQWHATRDLWNVWLRFFADESDAEDAAAARWVRSLDGIAMLSGEDPILVAASESSARIDGIRRSAREQLAGTFDANRLLAAAARRDARLAAQMRAAAPLGVALPIDVTRAKAAGMKDGDRGVVPTPGTDGWRLAPLRVEKGQVVWMDVPPDPPVTWPQVIFIQAEEKR